MYVRVARTVLGIILWLYMYAKVILHKFQLTLFNELLIYFAFLFHALTVTYEQNIIIIWCKN